MNEFQFFVHDDPDAVRIEIAGSLRGTDAETVYRAWKRAALPNLLKRAIVDITFVTSADEYGRALLVVMHRYGAQIIADSPDSTAIAQPLVNGPSEISDTKPSWLHRMIRFLREDRPAGAGLPAHAEIFRPASALARHATVEYREFGDAETTEHAVR